jgi:hypothetical protein
VSRPAERSSGFGGVPRSQNVPFTVRGTMPGSVQSRVLTDAWKTSILRGRWTVTFQGRILQVKQSGLAIPAVPSASRGCCGVFTREARRRMIFRINRIDWNRVGKCKFITLTYPDGYADRRFSQRTQDRYLMQRYIEKHLGTKVWTLWRTEWQTRKSGGRLGELMPHVHMLLGSARFLPPGFVNSCWRTILQCSSYVRTDTRGTNNGWHAAKYVAKYATKVDPSSLVVATYLNRVRGRCWGITRPELVPWYEWEEVEDVSPAAVEALFRMGAKRWTPLNDREPGSFTLLGTDAEEVYREWEKTLLCGDWSS